MALPENLRQAAQRRLQRQTSAASRQQQVQQARTRKLQALTRERNLQTATSEVKNILNNPTQFFTSRQEVTQFYNRLAPEIKQRVSYNPNSVTNKILEPFLKRRNDYKIREDKSLKGLSGSKRRKAVARKQAAKLALDLIDQAINRVRGGEFIDFQKLNSIVSREVRSAEKEFKLIDFNLTRQPTKTPTVTAPKKAPLGAIGQRQDGTYIFPKDAIGQRQDGSLIFKKKDEPVKKFTGREFIDSLPKKRKRIIPVGELTARVVAEALPVANKLSRDGLTNLATGQNVTRDQDISLGLDLATLSPQTRVLATTTRVGVKTVKIGGKVVQVGSKHLELL